MIPFSSFYRDVKAIAVPEGVGANVLDAFRNYVVNGLIRTQTFIPCLREYNTDFYVKMEAKDFCNTDILQGPAGQIQQLYVFKPSLDCRKYYYKAVSTNFINCWIDEQKCQCDPATPPTTNVYESPYCNYLIDGDVACAAPYSTGTEDDTNFIHCVDRYFGRGPDYKLYLAPRFPCGFVVAVHWVGVKRSYKDSDPVWEDDDIKYAIARFAEAELAGKDRDFISKKQLMMDYDELIRDIAYRCRSEQRTPDDPSCTVDSLLPFVNPLPENNPYSAVTGAQVGDATPSCVYCP